MKKLILLFVLFASNLQAQIASYPFSNGNLVDEVNLNNFTQIGSSLSTEEDRFGASSAAIRLNGDQLSRRDINFSNNGFYENTGTISFWIKTTTTDSNERTIFEDTDERSNQSDNAYSGYYIYLKDGKIGFSLRVLYENFGYRSVDKLSSKLINDGFWHHVVFKLYDDATVVYPNPLSATNGTYYHTIYGEVYIDGNSTGFVYEEQSSSNEAYLALSQSHNVTGNIIIGGNSTESLPEENSYQDYIDDVLIYDYLLSDEEVLELTLANDFCVAPQLTEMSSTNVTNNSATIQILASGTYDLAYHKSSELFSEATIVTDISSNSFDLVNLQGSTNYKVYIRNQCANNPTTPWSEPLLVRTERNIGRIYVDVLATGENSGASWENAYTSLGEALPTALEGEEIWVAKGTYIPTLEDEYDEVNFTIPNSNIKIYGGFLGTETVLSERNSKANETILSGDVLGNDDEVVSYVNTSRSDNCIHIIVSKNKSNILIDGFTITNAHADGFFSDGKDGGAIFSWFSDLTLRNSSVKNNVAAKAGAGVFSDSYGKFLKIYNCEFTNNLSRHGAAIYYKTEGNTSPEVVIESSLFSGNIVKDSPSLSGSAGSSGLFITEGSFAKINFSLTNNTYVNNQDSGSQLSSTFAWSPLRFLSFEEGTFNGKIANCIFWNNTDDIGGVSRSIHLPAANSGNTISVLNSIAQDNFYSISSEGATILNSTSAQLTNTSNVNPLFLDLENENYTLQANSPALDNGDNSAITVYSDILGNSRIYNATVDMGAYEFGASPYISKRLLINAENGTVSIDKASLDGTYEEGSSIILTAIPDLGYQFDGWSGAESGITNPLTIVMDTDKIITANFSQVTATIIDEDFNNTILIHPNPVNDLLNITAKDDIFSISVYTLQGKKIKETADKTLNTANFSKGMYLLKVKTKSGKVGVKRFIKL